MRVIKIILVLFLLFNTLELAAQNPPKCAMTDLNAISYTFQKEETLAKKNFKKNFRNWLQSDTGGVLTIKVVVHVLHAVEDNVVGKGTNISNEQIFSQIRILNEDYRKVFGSPGYNDNPVGADTEIDFCLATEDPNGQETSGITRDTIHNTNLRYPRDDEYIKSQNYWPPTKYLNVYVIPSLNGNSLGYAQFPWNFTSSPNTDGVVIVHRFFGDVGTTDFRNNPYNTGRTTTHEIGHYLGLRHIWGEVSGCGFADLPDSIDDTPDALTANYGCNVNRVSCNSPDMVENYMDYSNDTCFNIFTEGQKSLMRYVLTSGDFPHRTALLQNEIDCPDKEFDIPELYISATDDPDQVKIGGMVPFADYYIRTYSSAGEYLGEYSGTSDLDGKTILNIREISKGIVILRVVQSDRWVSTLKAVLTL